MAAGSVDFFASGPSSCLTPNTPPISTANEAPTARMILVFSRVMCDSFRKAAGRSFPDRDAKLGAARTRIASEFLVARLNRLFRLHVPNFRMAKRLFHTPVLQRMKA